MNKFLIKTKNTMKIQMINSFLKLFILFLSFIIISCSKEEETSSTVVSSTSKSTIDHPIN